jgi:phosphohistidine phosphatase
VLVYFLRHASAGQSKQNPELDARRPLDADGVEQCKDVGQALARAGVELDEIISSPLTRAMQTAVQMAKQLGFKKEIRQHPALAKEGALPAFRNLLKSYADREAVMVVGHNPSLSRMLSLLLTASGNDALIDLKKCGIAKVEYSTGRPAMLYWCLTPKLTQAIQQSAIKSSRPKTSRK